MVIFIKSLIYSLTLLLFVPLASKGQQLINRTTEVQGEEREYLVYLPRGFSNAESLPVVFCFHGGDDYAESMMRFTADFRPLADQHKFIAVYPQGLVFGGKGGSATNWNYKGPYDNGIDEIAFVESMIESVTSDYSCDHRRIFACGFSQGGNLMWDYASLLGDRFAAVASVAASMWQWTYDDFTPLEKIGVLTIHGTNDFYNPYTGNQYSISMDRLNRYWVEINGSEETASSSQYARGVTQYVWQGTEDCHSVEHFRVQGGLHDWPSFSERVIWEFFSKYDIDGLIDCREPISIKIDSYDLSRKELVVNIENLSSGNFEIRKSTGGEFYSFDPVIDVNENTQFPLIIGNVTEQALMIQLWEKP